MLVSAFELGSRQRLMTVGRPVALLVDPFDGAAQRYVGRAFTRSVRVANSYNQPVLDNDVLDRGVEVGGRDFPRSRFAYFLTSRLTASAIRAGLMVA